MPKKKFFSAYKITGYSKSKNAEGRLSMRGSLRLSFKSGLGVADNSFVTGNNDNASDSHDVGGSKKTIYMLSSMDVKDRRVLSCFNVRSLQ